MALLTGNFWDICADQYIDDVNKVIIISLFKHGSSTLSNTMFNSDNHFQFARDMPDFGEVSVHTYRSLYCLQDKYDDYRKYFIWRGYKDLWVSAFCYETRTSHIRALFDGEVPVIKSKLAGVINALGGPDVFVSTDFESMNGTYTSLCYYNSYPEVCEDILKKCDCITLSQLNNILEKYCSNIRRIDNKLNVTEKNQSQAVFEVFTEMGILDKLAVKYAKDAKWREALEEKIITDI